MSVLPATSQWLRANFLKGGQVGVDRANNVILGYVVAQQGPFKSDGRGQFDHRSLLAIKRLMLAEPNGLKSRFAHPTLSGDGLGTFLGRAKNARMGKVSQKQEDGSLADVPAVRADLHLDPTSFETPNGNLGKYVLDLAESDPAALSSSLVLKMDEEMELDADGKPVKTKDGELAPPIWRPTVLHASDVVDTGDAVDAFLSPEGLDALPDAVVRRGAELLDRQFAGQPREVVEARCLAWLNRYLELRYGETERVEQALIDQMIDAAERQDPDEPLRLEFDLRQRELA